jgi:hypothetical protein
MSTPAPDAGNDVQSLLDSLVVEARGAVAPAASVPSASSDSAPAAPSAPSAPTSSGAAPDAPKGSTMDTVQMHIDRIKADRAAKSAAKENEAKAYLLLIFDGELTFEEVPDEIKSILQKKATLASSGNALNGSAPHALPAGGSSELQALAVQLLREGKSGAEVAQAIMSHSSKPDKDTANAALVAAKKEVGA